MSTLGSNVRAIGGRKQYDPPGHILDVIMSALRISDARIVEHIRAEAASDDSSYSVSRQVMHKRRKLKTELSARDISVFATALGVPEEIFFGTAADALNRLTREQPERFAYSGDDGGDGAPAKLYQLAGVVQWESGDILPKAA